MVVTAGLIQGTEPTLVKILVRKSLWPALALMQVFGHFLLIEREFDKWPQGCIL